ncbi:MAG: radical SAM/SPASM family putative metalloenzyme maturase [Desulfobacterales bacterium]|nr:radical SAM/SPASM family putative metalloenzyme maturase [Desulfobacterales bacterium]
MCVKQSEGCLIKEGDMSLDVFNALKPLFPHIHTLILTGIGEPLLYENIESCISMAKIAMPSQSTIGFQTNGKLLTRDKALSLVRAGMNKICISVDASDPFLFSSLRAGGSFSEVEAGFEALKLAQKSVPGSKVQTGVEFVLMKKNLDQLPKVVEWAGKKEVGFILVTHVTAYDPGTEKEQAFMDNSNEGLELFEQFSQKAAKKNLDMGQYNNVRWKFKKSPKDIDLYNLVQSMKDTALDKGIYLNLFHLMDEDEKYFTRISTLFERARQKANQYGIELVLPQIRPKIQRYCPFVEEDTFFVNWEGDVSPCYFLWHKYQAMRIGYTKTVNPVFFGNVLETDPLAIWNSDAFADFRAKVKTYDYPNCHSWCETRCDYVLNDPFYQDCFINDIPCCDCHWNLGFLNCLN